MPSLHSSGALIVGVVMAAIVRRRLWKALWLAWPVWVWFTVIATANHFWLDVAAGVLVAVAAGLIVFGGPRLRRRPRLA
jgi:membrane-associated phospholipid phosphatase